MPPNTPPFHLLLIIHAHQPAGNFENVLEDCFQHSYEAFLTMVEKHPRIRMAVHLSGPLFLWTKKSTRSTSNACANWWHRIRSS